MMGGKRHVFEGEGLKIPKVVMILMVMVFSLKMIPQAVAAVSPTTLGPKITIAEGSDPDIAVDSNGDLHVAYVRGGSTYYRKVYMPYEQGVMSKEYYVGGAGNPQIAVDGNRRAHVVFGKAHYAYWTGAGFSSSIQAFSGWRKNLIAVDSRNRVYIIADRYSPRDVLVRPYFNGQPLTGAVEVGGDNPGGVDVDASDVLHLTWRSGNTYYNTYSLAGGPGTSLRLPNAASDFSWCSVDKLRNNIHVAYTAAYAKGIYYSAKKNNQWRITQTLALEQTDVHEPDNINPVSANDSRGYTYITFAGWNERGYFMVMNGNDELVDGVRWLDPEHNTNPGGKMKNPNVASSSNTKGAFVAWGTENVFIRSIGYQKNVVVKEKPVILEPMLSLLLKNEVVVEEKKPPVIAPILLLLM